MAGLLSLAAISSGKISSSNSTFCFRSARAKMKPAQKLPEKRPETGWGEALGRRRLPDVLPYFLPVIEEVLASHVSPEYFEYLRYKLARTAPTR